MECVWSVFQSFSPWKWGVTAHWCSKRSVAILYVFLLNASVMDAIQKLDIDSVSKQTLPKLLQQTCLKQMLKRKRYSVFSPGISRIATLKTFSRPNLGNTRPKTKKNIGIISVKHHFLQLNDILLKVLKHCARNIKQKTIKFSFYDVFNYSKTELKKMQQKALMTSAWRQTLPQQKHRPLKHLIIFHVCMLLTFDTYRELPKLRWPLRKSFTSREWIAAKRPPVCAHMRTASAWLFARELVIQ